ncbi:unnamed protein product, partial [Staurois parvus]
MKNIVHHFSEHGLVQCFSIPVLMDPQQVMFSGFPSDETAVVITKAVKLIKSPVQNNGNPENMTCWGSMRTGVEKHCPR